MDEDDVIILDDLQEQHRVYAEIIGIQGLLGLAEQFGGTQIYIPKKEELTKGKKYKAISEEFDGRNIRELARKYGVSESTVYRVVRSQIIKNEERQCEGQMRLEQFLG